MSCFGSGCLLSGRSINCQESAHTRNSIRRRRPLTRKEQSLIVKRRAIPCFCITQCLERERRKNIQIQRVEMIHGSMQSKGEHARVYMSEKTTVKSDHRCTCEGIEEARSIQLSVGNSIRMYLSFMNTTCKRAKSYVCALGSRQIRDVERMITFLCCSLASGVRSSCSTMIFSRFECRSD